MLQIYVTIDCNRSGAWRFHLGAASMAIYPLTPCYLPVKDEEEGLIEGASHRVSDGKTTAILQVKFRLCKPIFLKKDWVETSFAK